MDYVNNILGIMKFGYMHSSGRENGRHKLYNGFIYNMVILITYD